MTVERLANDGFSCSGGVVDLSYWPTRWIEDTLLALVPRKGNSPVWRKLLIGVPFYGYRDGEAVLAHDVIQTLMTNQVDIAWDKTGKEHIYRYSNSAPVAMCSPLID